MSLLALVLQATCQPCFTALPLSSLLVFTLAKKPDNACQSLGRKKHDGPFSPDSALHSIPPTLLTFPSAMDPQGSPVVDRMGCGSKQVSLARGSLEAAISSESGPGYAEVLTYWCSKLYLKKRKKNCSASTVPCHPLLVCGFTTLL